MEKKSITQNIVFCGLVTLKLDNYTLFAYSLIMTFTETKLFTKLIYDYLTDDEFIEFQNYLIENPETGDLIKKTGGLRKVRWKAKGKGKRSGVRIIYYWYKSMDQIFLLTVFAKNEVSDLSEDERKILKQIVEEWKND